MDAAATAPIVDHIAPDLIKPAKAAERLQIATSTLAVWRSTGRRKLAYVKIGGQVRYRLEDLDRFIAENLRMPKTSLAQPAPAEAQPAVA